MKLLILCVPSLLLLILSACGSQHSVAQKKAGAVTTVNQNNIASKDAVIIISHSPCYGTCPAYTMTINSSGKVIFTGQRFVSKLGVYEKDLGKQAIDDLIDRIEQAGIWDMKDAYPSLATDLPETIISFNRKGKTKSIKGADNAPQSLRDIIKLLNDIGNNDDGWKKVGNVAKPK